MESKRDSSGSILILIVLAALIVLGPWLANYLSGGGVARIEPIQPAPVNSQEVYLYVEQPSGAPVILEPSITPTPTPTPTPRPVGIDSDGITSGACVTSETALGVVTACGHKSGE